MNFFKTAKSVIQEPTKFFKKIEKDKDISKAALYYLIFLVIGFAASIIHYWAQPIGIGLKLPALAISIVISLFVFIISIIFLFIGAGIIHLLLKFLGGKEGFYKTFNPLVYGNTPSLIVSPIMTLVMAASLNIFTNIFVSLILFGTMIYSFFLIIKGVSIMHKMSMWRAFVAVVLIPLVIGTIIIVILIMIALVFGFMIAAGLQ